MSPVLEERMLAAIGDATTCRTGTRSASARAFQGCRSPT